MDPYWAELVHHPASASVSFWVYPFGLWIDGGMLYHKIIVCILKCFC